MLTAPSDRLVASCPMTIYHRLSQAVCAGGQYVQQGNPILVCLNQLAVVPTIRCNEKSQGLNASL